MMPSKRLIWALALSILVHLVLSLVTSLLETPASNLVSVNQVQVEFLDKIRRDETKKMQIVEQNSTPMNSEVDPNARYLSEHNQQVKKQTQAVQRGEFRNNAGQSLAAFLPQFKAPMAAEKALQEDLDKEVSLEKRMHDKLLQEQQKLDAQTKAQSPLASQNLVSQTLDYIKDLDPGLETLLSTREFVYFSYYKRIRQQLNQHWTPEVQKTVKKIYASGRQIASNDDKITKCLITLDNSGRLLRVQIIGQSGVRDLDEAAVRAFHSAAPFPNPPKGIEEKDGTIRIRWDFILEA
ncbi:MAG: energy transducer TonB [Bdellovibrio sp.]